MEVVIARSDLRDEAISWHIEIATPPESRLAMTVVVTARNEAVS
jgi:hypothetical protein